MKRGALLLLLMLALGPPGAAEAKPKAKAAKLKPAKPKPPRIDTQGQQVQFGNWAAVAAFADDLALRHGFVRAELDTLLAEVRYIDAAVQLVKPGPVGKPKNMHAVRALMIDPVRIATGSAFWQANAATLARAEQRYGVPAATIVGILGIETVYGRNTGNFRVLDVLTTLAFAYPPAPNQAARMAFFKGELEHTLLLARRDGIDPFSLRGSFAGAIGLPQFMPGSVLAYGVDFDDDGHTDLHTAADAIGSIANFLARHGWQKDSGPALYRARVGPELRWQRYLDQGLAARSALAELQAAGVTAAAPPGNYGLVALQNGAETTEYWLASDNFYAITHYNRSYYYAMSVLELGRAVAEARGQPITSRETL